MEGLLLLKLHALPSLYQQGNFARVGIYENDIATLIHYYQPDMPALINELSNYMDGNDLAEIKNIVSDIQDLIKRFKNESRQAFVRHINQGNDRAGWRILEPAQEPAPSAPLGSASQRRALWHEHDHTEHIRKLL